MLRLLQFFRRSSLLALLAVVPAFAADNITGVVTNKTTNKPAAGDDVVLIRLQQGMQESTRTKTDARGRFTLQVPDDGVHLVRVTHDKANYFRPAPPGTQTVEIEVYNAAAHVKGVSSEADVLRIQTDAGGNSLHVVENFFVKNESKPPLTQFSDRPFEFTLPDGAVVEGSAALAPGGMPVQAAPVPLEEKGHYTFLFPVRPGETRFQITYRVPYTGSFTFSPHPSMTTDTVAIMLPKSMNFKPDASSPYSPVTEEVNAQTFVARNVSSSQPLGFALSGAGQLPRDPQNPDQGGGGNQTATSAADANAAAGVDANGNPDTTKFGGGLGKPLDPEADHDPWAKYKWWILGGLALLLAAAAGVLLRRPAVAQTSAHSPSADRIVGPALSSHDALKEELFALETDRLQKKITEADYAAHKSALDLVLLRALNRSGAAASPRSQERP